MRHKIQRNSGMVFGLWLAATCAPPLHAEEDYGVAAMRLQQYSLSLLVGQVADDFTAGLDLTSNYRPIEEMPGVFVALRYRANLAIMRTVNKLENTVKSFPYNFHRLGITSTSQPHKTYRMYVDGDVLLCYPNKYFSEYYALGAYFGAGIELYTNLLNNSAYYVEGGYYVSDGLAENVKGSPKYMNGGGMVLGWRYFL
ncbi:MAG: hypothetical protein AABY83_06280 [Pseudomonadota bacterium]